MGGIEELWQEYNVAGEPVGEGLTKAQARSGILHGASHVWLWRKDNGAVEVLLQKRADDKPTWPGYFDISAAGHIDFGESPIQAALREMDEELGVALTAEELELFFVYHKPAANLPGGIIEEEFQWVYGVEHNNDSFTYVDGEVTSVEWHTLESVRDMVAGKLQQKKIVAHRELYFMNLFAALEKS